MIELLKEHWVILFGAVMWLIGWLHGSCKRKGRETFEERCTTCKEYDQKNHCCHRWTDCIRRTVDELKEYYAFHSIEEKPDESGEYIIQYSDGRMEVEPFDADRNLFGRVVGVFDFASGKESEEFCLEDEDDMVAWARLPERYEGDNENE